MMGEGTEAMMQRHQGHRLIAVAVVIAAGLCGGTVLAAQDDLDATRRAAEQGDADAQYLLGARYALGQGVAQDDAEAVRWLRLAAEQDHIFAQRDLGFLYAEGQGVAQDDAEAARWFRRAAEQGDADAQTELDRLLAADSADDQASDLVIPTPPQIRSSPGRLTRPEPERRRSWSRTITGGFSVFAGIGIFVEAYRVDTCSRGYCPSSDGVLPYVIAGGLMTLGGLLVTRWSDVSVSNAIDFTVTPDRVQIGKTFGF